MISNATSLGKNPALQSHLIHLTQSPKTFCKKTFATMLSLRKPVRSCLDLLSSPWLFALILAVGIYKDEILLSLLIPNLLFAISSVLLWIYDFSLAKLSHRPLIKHKRMIKLGKLAFLVKH
jgi:hypothetical protein